MSGWVYTANGGYIGLWTIGGNATYYDDYGGGDLPISYNLRGSKVLAAYHPEPVVRVKSAPRQYVRPRSMHTLSRDPGVVWRSYYYAGATRIAMREESDVGSEVYYILTDHLGSTAVTYRASDGLTATQKYKPWGETRQVTGELPTDRTFQGQRDAGWGLYHFKARWFDGGLGRFTQADTIVPGAGNPLAWDRYAGLFNNLVNYIDPTGHETCDADGYCGSYGVAYWNWVSDRLEEAYNIVFSDGWSLNNQIDVLTAITIVGERFNNELSNMTSSEAFRSVYGLLDGDTFYFEWDENCWGCRDNPEDDPEFGFTNSENHIEFASMSIQSSLRRINNVIHELGHAFNIRLERIPENSFGVNPQLLQRPAGFYGIEGQFTWVQSPEVTPSETFADQFIGWGYGLWGNDTWGPVRAEFMLRMNGPTGWVAKAARLP